mmetsp:Transcript_7279/g.11464  ORF Transcript_7279/g.11464 Transcript_7279/m.11464 type:complete len:188 (-) Transcript_7279:1203-1766(-)
MVELELVKDLILECFSAVDRCYCQSLSTAVYRHSCCLQQLQLPLTLINAPRRVRAINGEVSKCHNAAIFLTSQWESFPAKWHIVSTMMGCVLRMSLTQPAATSNNGNINVWLYFGFVNDVQSPKIALYFSVPSNSSCFPIESNETEFAAIKPEPATAGTPMPGKHESPHSSKFFTGVFGNGKDASPA